jgi:hypothetical protein
MRVGDCLPGCWRRLATSGWVVVEAEQDPARANPLKMARIGHKALTNAFTAAFGRRSRGQRCWKRRSASLIWRPTIGLRMAPSAGSLASADRPSGVPAKEASASSSLASKRSTMALIA